MKTASSAAEMSHAVRAKVGAVIVKDNNILAYGYNGTPAGFDNTCENYHTMIKNDGTRIIELSTKPEVLHAESNSISKVARSTNSAEGATLYVTLSPCLECAKLIIQAGIKKVVYKETYRDTSSITLLEKCNVEVIQVER